MFGVFPRHASGSLPVPSETSPPPPSLLLPLCSRRQSLDSSCDILCLKERIQKSQEEREKRDERLLQTQADVEEEEETICFTDPTRFITDPNFCYQEFARREEDHFQILRVQDYSWEDHGFSLVNRLYSDIGHFLDDRFRRVTTLPSLHSPDLKRAIWNYIHCVLGIRYDDYDYGEVNRLLGRDLKLHIKAVACFPDATKTPMCLLSWSSLKTSEWTHVNLLIMEARLQAELLYALRAITQYMIA
ncbi:sestrin-3 [Brachionichthys hirsutus]|uniref:sestrin-3 n=1 Tax=Brachionichthys hirsutus TaxID=412623 RepID=UPI003605144B